MKKTMKLYEATNIYEITKGIIENKDSNITSLSKFKLLGIIRSFSGIYTDYDQTRQDLVKKYGEPVLDKEGNKTGNIEIKKDSENMDKFVEEMNVLRNQNIDVEFTSMTVDELFSLGLSAELYAIFVPIVEE
jgi:hypothetical protein|nr:MAG TPA: Protein of unknown function (DUF1617) [Caudoviricetes sp.]